VFVVLCAVSAWHAAHTPVHKQQPAGLTLVSATTATRFDVIVRTMGDSHYPGEFKDEFERPWFQYKEKVLHLVAPDAKVCCMGEVLMQRASLSSSSSTCASHLPFLFGMLTNLSPKNSGWTRCVP